MKQSPSKRSNLRIQGVIFFLLTSIFLSISGISQLKDLSTLDIPYEKVILDNGLTVIVHEDHKAPIVAVNVWYHVGSKNEKPGKTGFAHLFEHLMFNGSENFNEDYFKPFEEIGVTDINGTTNWDRTNYFENVPVSSLDMALWMESDRMGHLLGAIDSAKLEEQRGVVQNEKRQGDNEPYSQVMELISKNCFPSGHPYSWTVIGSMEDLSAATLEDAHEWFRSYYGAANAVLVVAGDVETESTIEKVKQYFEDIPSGPPVARHETYVAKRSGVIRQVIQDRVPQVRIYKVWNTPEWGTVAADQLDLIGGILATGKNSRLYKRLVYEEQIATDVSASPYNREISGIFQIVASVKPGEDVKRMEEIIDEELNKFLKEGPTEEELNLVKTQFLADFIRGMERIGGFGGKSDILATNQVYGGSPDYYKTTLQHVNTSTKEHLLETAVEWLSEGQYILEVQPFPEYSTKSSGVDRSTLPASGNAPAPDFPEFQRATLSNGLEIILAERHAVPVVNFYLMVDAGFASEENILAGTSNVTMQMLDEGTTTMDALEINKQLNLLGASLSSGSSMDISYLQLSALKENLEASLELYGDLLLHPSFPENEYTRIQKNQISTIKQEEASPVGMAIRLLPGYLYGKDHAYSGSITGSGTEASISALTTGDLRKYYEKWFIPNNSTLIVTGDITLEEVTPILENVLSNWEKGPVPEKRIRQVNKPDGPSIYLIDKPDSPQSFILAGNLVPPRADESNLAMNILNTIVGGKFTSRLNMNLREGKHWSYGVQSVILDARGQRPFVVVAPIQGDKTKNAILEIQNELRISDEKNPITQEELESVKKNEVLKLPGTWETIQSVSNSLEEIVQFGLSDDYFQNYPEDIRNLELNQIKIAQGKTLSPDRMVWLVVGDRSKIEESLNDLGMGKVKVIDKEGNLME
jgi:zinc protease